MLLLSLEISNIVSSRDLFDIIVVVVIASSWDLPPESLVLVQYLASPLCVVSSWLKKKRRALRKLKPWRRLVRARREEGGNNNMYVLRHQQIWKSSRKEGRPRGTRSGRRLVSCCATNQLRV
jgi:hypothetical protein